MKLTRMVVFVGVATGWPAAAQSFDVSGNGLLNGTYYFRQVLYQVADSSGSLADAISVFGNMTFDGNGKYTMSGTFVDGAAGSIQTFSAVAGTYSISASGFGVISNPVSNPTSDSVNGLVSHGIFIGSSTENQGDFNDLFIAAPLASPVFTNASFQGAYSFAYMNFPSGDPSQVYDAQFQMSPDGRGNVGTVNVTGYIGQNGSTAFNATEPGVRYLFSNGAAVVTFPNSTNLPIVGQEYLYFSPDGNFVFGGSPNGFDMLVGVKVTSGAMPNFSGLYYQVGFDEDESTLASGYASPDSYYGSFYALPSGDLVGHQRVLAVLTTGAYDYTYSGKSSLNPDGSYDDGFGFHHVLGLGGALRIGSGKGPFLGINVALQAPTFTGPGVFLNPTGIQNAASSALFTAGIAPGEYIALSGTNLAPKTATDPAFQPSLGGVQVMINGTPAPLHLVSPTFILALVPYGTAPLSLAAIQVINNNVASNTVTVLTSMTAPGLFTQTANGLGAAAAQHSDYSLITASNPAKTGETIILYGTGLGAVSPTITDGGAAPSNPPSSTTSTIAVDFGGSQATAIPFAGLTPTASGLYQLNVQIPSGAGSGAIYVDVSGPDSFTSQAFISVGSGGAAARLVRTNDRPAWPHRPAASKTPTRRTLPQ